MIQDSSRSEWGQRQTKKYLLASTPLSAPLGFTGTLTPPNLGSWFWVPGSGFWFWVLVLGSGFQVLRSGSGFGPRSIQILTEPEPRTQNQEPRTRECFRPAFAFLLMSQICRGWRLASKNRRNQPTKRSDIPKF